MNIIKTYILDRYKLHNKVSSIITVLNNNNEIMYNCFFEISKIYKLYPPKKNENKFIFGKLIEIALCEAFKKIGYSTYLLDNNHKYGSEYKFDIILLKEKFSIKASSKRNNSIIIINKNNKKTHINNIDTIVCNIEDKQIYFIPYNIVPQNYIKDVDAKIEYKGSLFTYLRKNYSHYIYNFPKLTPNDITKLEIFNEINIIIKLYNDTILS